jgi:hypothetical protein
MRCFACGILPTFVDLRRENPGKSWMCPEVKPKKQRRKAKPVLISTDQVDENN